MGNNKSKTIKVENIQYHLSQCEEMGQKNCPIYGNLHQVLYNNLEICLGESHSNHPPSDSSLHYLVPPNLLIIPQFTLLENAKPASFESLVDLIIGVTEMASNCQVGFGHNRIGFSGRWGIVGQNQPGWAYQQVLQNPNAVGIYLSPQLVLGLSQQKLYPKHNPIKSDMFAFGIMILEIIFQQKLTHIFDYHEYEIKLKPLLEKLNIVRQEFGQPFYNIILRMLQLDEEQRIDFHSLLSMLDSLGKKSTMNNSYMTSSNNSTNEIGSNFKSPLSKRNSAVYRNDCSPFKGGNVFAQHRTPERISNKTPTKQGNGKLYQKESNRSPLKRDLRINTQFGKENGITNASGYLTSRSPNKPSLLRKQGVSPLSKR